MNNREDIIKFLKENKAFKENGNLSSGITTLLRNKYSKIIKKMQEILDIETENVSQLIWHLVNNVNEVPKCPICGKDCEFKSYGLGYKKTCSSECNKKYIVIASQESNLKKYGTKSPFGRPEVLQKCRDTCEERYGYSNPFESEEIQEKIKKTNLEKYGYEVSSKAPEVKEKMRQTNQERYGVDAPLQSKEYLDKVRATTLERYGVENSLSSLELRSRGKKTSLEKYGTEWPQQNEEIKRKSSKKRMDNFYNSLINEGRIEGITPLFTREEYHGYMYIYRFQCNHCGHVFEDDLSHGHIPRCPICYPKTGEGSSEEEAEVFKFIKDNYDGPINRNFRKGMKELPGFELDIYLPDLNLAIEYDGLYWHNTDVIPDPNYHLNKTLACEKEGIKLFHIFSDEWHLKKSRDIIKSLLLSALGKYKVSIGARKCNVKEVPKEEAKIFLNNNHLQGYTASSVNIGLYLKDELLALLSFNKSRYDKNYTWEITRYCNKLNTHIPGGFSKMMKYFREHYEGSIITYSDRSKFTGDVYRNNNFKELTPTKPNYYYTKDYNHRESRLTFQKYKLIEKFPEYKDLSEKEIMSKIGYKRFYDCGNWKFELI